MATPIRALLLSGTLLSLAPFVVACGDDDDPCEGSQAPAECDRPCSEARPCPDGLYCDGERGVCTADCVDNGDCSDDQVCNDSGQCVAREEDASMPPTRPRDASYPDYGNTCPNVEVAARRVTPTVIFVIDQSDSMNLPFGDSTRWDALRDSLLDPENGLIPPLADQVRFGLALYSAEAEGGAAGPPIGECPLLTQVEARVDNYEAIRATYEAAEPIDETPTGDAIEAVLDDWLGQPDRPTDPVILILATDGDPDRCEELNPQNGQAETIAAVDRAFAANIRTFVISVGPDVSTDHLQDVANAGLGIAASGTDAEFWVAGEDGGLRTALQEIIGGELSCTLELSSPLRNVDDACRGTVTLNDREVPCDDPDGWRAVDEDTIELLGDSCEELQTTPGVTLRATFPCDVPLI